MRHSCIRACCPPHLPASLENTQAGFYYTVGIFYGLFGTEPVMVSLFNTFLSVGLGILAYHVTLSVGDHRRAIIALLLCLGYPQFVSASYFVLKDMAATFLVVAVMWGLYAVKGHARTLIAVAALMMMAYFRFGQALVVGALALAQLMWDELSRTRRARHLIMLGATVVVVGAFLANARIGGYHVGTIGFTTNVSAYHAEDEGFLRGQRLDFSLDSLQSIGMTVVGNPLTFAAYSAETVFHTFWGPPYLYSRSGANLHPYDVAEPPYRVLLESAGGLFLTALMPLIAMGWLDSLRTGRRETFFLWAFPVVWTLVLVFTGTVVRWRLPMIPALLVLAALWWPSRRRFRGVYPLYVIGFVTLVASNASLGQSLVIGKAIGVGAVVLLGAAAARPFRDRDIGLVER